MSEPWISVEQIAEHLGVTRVNQSNINATKMRQIKIPVPTLSAQKKFVAGTEALERTLAVAQATLFATPARKQAIMQHYL